MRSPTHKPLSPWVAHLRNLDRPAVLAELVAMPATPIYGLQDNPVEVARKRLEVAWNAIYVPSAQDLELMIEVIQQAIAHALRWYTDGRTFLSNIYNARVDMPPAVPICLIGLSGVGKSALLRALRMAFEPPSVLIIAADDHAAFPWLPMRTALIRRSQNVSAVMGALCGKSFSSQHLHAGTAQWLYRTGACFNALDELQFLTHSELSRALVSRLLLDVAGLGVPMLYICNFSLCHRLLKLHHEMRQAVLSNIRLLTPSLPDSAQWKGCMREFQNAAPGVFGFDLVRQRRQLWNYSAGLKRNAQALLLHAYGAVRHSRRPGTAVTWADVESAYVSTRYFAARQEVQALISHAATGAKIARGLVCPFDDDSNAEYERALKDLQRGRFVAAVQKTAMTKAERSDLELVRRDAEERALKNAQQHAKSPPDSDTRDPENARASAADAQGAVSHDERGAGVAPEGPHASTALATECDGPRKRQARQPGPPKARDKVARAVRPRKELSAEALLAAGRAVLAGRGKV